MDVSWYLNATESSAADGFSRWLIIYSLKLGWLIVVPAHYNRNIFIKFMPQVDFPHLTYRRQISLIIIYTLFYFSQSCTDWRDIFWKTVTIFWYINNADTFSRISFLSLAQTQKHINWAKTFVCSFTVLDQ